MATFRGDWAITKEIPAQEKKHKKISFKASHVKETYGTNEKRKICTT